MLKQEGGIIRPATSDKILRRTPIPDTECHEKGIERGQKADSLGYAAVLEQCFRPKIAWKDHEQNFEGIP